MRTIPPENENGGTREGLILLARAIDAVPTRRAVAVGEASRIITLDADNLETGSVNEPALARPAYHAFDTAAGVFSLLADGPYRDVKGIHQAIDQLRLQTTRLDPSGTVSEQRDRVLQALSTCDRILTLLASAQPHPSRRQ